MITTRDGFTVDTASIEKVEALDDGYEITKNDGWTFYLDKDECQNFVPQVGDFIITSQGVNSIPGIIIEGHVIRWKSKKQIDAEHERWKKELRLKRLEQYISEGDALKERAKNLPKPLRERMERFAKEDGVDFWIESAAYEMYACEGAAALLRKVQELGLIANVDSEFKAGEHQAAVDWINDWWDINSDKHDPPYDYKKQMEIVPDFGDGHSGWTASAAKGLAIAVLEGVPV